VHARTLCAYVLQPAWSLQTRGEQQPCLGCALASAQLMHVCISFCVLVRACASCVYVYMCRAHPGSTRWCFTVLRACPICLPLCACHLLSIVPNSPAFHGVRGAHGFRIRLHGIRDAPGFHICPQMHPRWWWRMRRSATSRAPSATASCGAQRPSATRGSPL